MSVRQQGRSYIRNGSSRRFDDNGYLHVTDNVLTGEEVANYLGKEILGYQDLGLEPYKQYGLYRPLNELEKGAETFKNLPMTDGHIWIEPDNPHQNKWVGTSGTDVEIKGRELVNSIAVYTKQAIDAITAADSGNGGKKDLSCGYTYDLVSESGVHDGKPYQFRMINISGNHVALVAEGRHPRAAVADENINSEKGITMSIIQTIVKTFANSKQSHKQKAIDAILSLADTTATDDASKLKHAEAIIELAKQVKANDSNADLEMPSERKERSKLSMDEESDEDEDNKDKKAKDEDKDDDKDKKAEDKKGKDEEPDDEEKEKKRDKAMDEAVRARTKVVRMCSGVIGMSPQYVEDSSIEQLIDNALTKNKLSIEGRSLDAKLAMLEMLSSQKDRDKLVRKPATSRATDSKPVSAGYKSLIPNRKGSDE